jgi:hypothetical protein
MLTAMGLDFFFNIPGIFGFFWNFRIFLEFSDFFEWNFRIFLNGIFSQRSSGIPNKIQTPNCGLRVTHPVQRVGGGGCVIVFATSILPATESGLLPKHLVSSAGNCTQVLSANTHKISVFPGVEHHLAASRHKTPTRVPFATLSDTYVCAHLQLKPRAVLVARLGQVTCALEAGHMRCTFSKKRK